MTVAPPPPPPEPGFPIHALRAMIGGASALDVPRLTLTSEADAEGFLEGYGFAWSQPRQREELESLRRDALAFIEEELLDPGEAMPPEVREEQDVRRLLLSASGDTGWTRQRWSCALLRVMHVLAHTHSPLDQLYGPLIRAQIRERFEAHIHRRGGALILGLGPDAIPLVSFEVRPSKTVRSMTFKLLHKPQNVATDIFDRVGVRFVTPTVFDALLVVRFLRRRSVVMFPNIKPARSRNTLVDLSEVEEALDALRPRVRAGELSEAACLDLLREQAALWRRPGGERDDNPFTDADWNSIQFTCRQMIRVGDALRFFFPFEVQILDEASYARAVSGRASHDEYKRRQRDAVRRRVLGPLVG
ncbi:MAG: TIGR04552 family protein [Alphaproteobacteria bacterium]|nr:TIGR04552 family protein [Alphaproteobacteria bacterium]